MNGSELGGRYRVEARIGSGGMAEVFRGVDPVLNRTVAIKVLLPQFARDASFVDRFRREAQAAARLNHPNIVGVYDTGADDGTQFIVMEFIEGRTLAEFLSTGGRLTPIQAAEIAQKICVALAEAHAQGVIHRDIKPGNVMVTRDGTVKVMDFGIARFTSGVETAPQTSAVLGTASYLSPEQAQGDPVDARTDIYSLGTVLYEMLAGRPPFTGDSPVAIAFKQVNEAPAAPSRLNRDVPPALDAVVMRALSKNPANRYQSAQEFADDLERVLNGHEVEATPLLPGGADATQVISRSHSTQVLPPPIEPEGSGSKVWLGVLIGALIVALLGAGGYLLVKSLTEDTGGAELIEVPDLVGKQYEEAKADLSALGLRIQDPPETKETDAKKPGTILSQDPQEGTKLGPDGVVNVVVAKAPTTTIVPNLQCMTLGEAQTALTEADLELGSQTPQASTECEPDQIVGQTPVADDEVKKGTLVDVFVSTGPEQVSVPDVSSQCLSQGGARKILTDAGLQYQLGGTAPSSPSCPNPNRVVDQQPDAGTPVESGSVVTVFTGDGSSPSASP
jgi:beta-lactam-binding protein with PASTA domain/predicted Ser/Thr protein kinase